MLGHATKLQERRVVEPRDRVEPRDWRWPAERPRRGSPPARDTVRLRPRSLRCRRSARDGERAVRAPRPRPARFDGPSATFARRRLLRSTICARSTSTRTDVHAQAGRCSRHMRGTSARDHRLGGSAARVDAGTADGHGLEEDDAPAGSSEANRERFGRLTAADDEDIGLLHDVASDAALHAACSCGRSTLAEHEALDRVGEPLSSLEPVTWRAARCTSGLALPMAMLMPLRANIRTSLGMSPIVAIFSAGIAELLREALHDRALVRARVRHVDVVRLRPGGRRRDRRSVRAGRARRPRPQAGRR